MRVADIREVRHIARMLKTIRSPFLAFSIVIVSMIVGCDGPAPDQNIIIDRQPFYKVTLPYRDGSEDAIVSTVKAFAGEHGMDFLGGPGHPTLDAGQFNLTASGKTINLKAIRVVTSLPNTEVFATVRAIPTASDQALVAEFVRRVRQAQQSEGQQR